MKSGKLQMAILLLWILVGHVVTTVHMEGAHMRRLSTICSELHRCLG